MYKQKGGFQEKIRSHQFETEFLLFYLLFSILTDLELMLGAEIVHALCAIIASAIKF